MPSPWRTDNILGNKIRLTPEQVRRYREGQPIRSLAAELGIGIGELYKVLRWQGVFVRRRG